MKDLFKVTVKIDKTENGWQYEKFRIKRTELSI